MAKTFQKFTELIEKNRVGFLCLLLSLAPYASVLYQKGGCTNFYADISGLIALFELLLLVYWVSKKKKGLALIATSMVVSAVGFIVLITFCY